MKKKYMAPVMEMHKMESANLICVSQLNASGAPIGNGGSNKGKGAISADSRRFDVEDDIFDEFENGSIWDF